MAQEAAGAGGEGITTVADDAILSAKKKKSAANAGNADAEGADDADEEPAEVEVEEDDGADVRVLERWTQTREEALAELRTLSQDEAWLDHATRHLPATR